MSPILKKTKKGGSRNLQGLRPGWRFRQAQTLLAEDYIQHNPNCPIGAAAAVNFAPTLKESGIEMTTHRVLADGDLVAMHSELQKAVLFGEPSFVTFDILRIKDGKAVEYRDALQAIVPKEKCKSGRSMVDGTTEVTDLDKTEENKKCVTEFVDTVLVGGECDKITDFFSTEKYLQHNPDIADNISCVGEAFAALAAPEKALLLYTKNRLVITLC